MAAGPPPELMKKRLLRMTVAHYKNEACSEEDFYRWMTDVTTPQVVKLFTKHGLEGYNIHFSPASFRAMVRGMGARRAEPWNVRGHDFQIEMYFRSPATMAGISNDPEFHALQATEGPYVSQIHTEASLGWVETYIQDGKVVNVSADEKSEYLGWAAMSAAGPPGGPPGPPAGPPPS